MENLSVCEERLKKQTFLKKEILEKGYDPQEFQEFLEKKKCDGGTNVDLWEYQELKDVYLFFKTRFLMVLLAYKRVSFNKKHAF